MTLPPIRHPHAAADPPPPEWVEIAQFLGASGRQRDALRRQRDITFGLGRWCLRWRYGDASISGAEAIALYEEAYLSFLAATPDLLDWICRTASDVYDNAPSNVHSAHDYAVQETSADHLQDVAIRRSLARIGRRFEGDHPVEVRGPRSEGFRLNPGVVPFHEPEEIWPAPAWRTRPVWWTATSVEAFYQENKLLVVAPEALRLRPIVVGAEGLWCVLEADPHFALVLDGRGTRRCTAMPTRKIRSLWSVAAVRRAHARIEGAPSLDYLDLAALERPAELHREHTVAWNVLEQRLAPREALPPSGAT